MSRATSRKSTRRRSPSAKSHLPSVAVLSIGAAVLAGGAALIGIFARRRKGVVAPGDVGHAAPDLALDLPRPGPTDRAPDVFRPDPTAPVPDSEREALRPATGPAPTLVNANGTAGVGAE